MRLKNLYVRFYKSFNFDYLRKFDSRAEALPWESVDNMWYPYVRIPINTSITTIVGENESGKTHLLRAIEEGLKGVGIKRKDFCRYSKFFTVEAGKMRQPEFGFEFGDLYDKEEEVVREACSFDSEKELDTFHLFRESSNAVVIYLLENDKKYSRFVVGENDRSEIEDILPRARRLRRDVALPESVPIRWLMDKGEGSDWFGNLSRERRFQLFDEMYNWSDGWFSSTETIEENSPQIRRTIRNFSSSNESTKNVEEEFELAWSLVREIANIDREALSDLLSALKEGNDAYADSLTRKINDALADSLNFPKWWAQDREFELRVTARDNDLVFTIGDRTGKYYSFGERSSGLRFFFSYYIQYRSFGHSSERSDILVMDEPDAYLSSQGQQDLLKIFEAFAFPEEDLEPVQVVYVTHSPFLIDKNHGERIRVLQKGEGDEGTRVVRDASRNHYEPLRSSFGSFVGETTFIGNCNLMTEGPADQILLAGMSMHIRSNGGVSGFDNLDLNQLTIVPASGASHIPYLVYLARGRDVEKPAVIVLLDSDTEGTRAKKDLARGGPRRRELLKKEYILQVGDLSGIPAYSEEQLYETEDLIPLKICVQAAKRYIKEVCRLDTEQLGGISDKKFREIRKDHKSNFKAIQRLINETTGRHIEKIGFVRSVLDVVKEMAHADSPNPEVEIFTGNMRALFRRLNEMSRLAKRELTIERISNRVDREKNSFLRDHAETVTKEAVFLLFEGIEAVLDDSPESDAVRMLVSGIRRDFDIPGDPQDLVDNYEVLKLKLEELKYIGRLMTQEY